MRRGWGLPLIFGLLAALFLVIVLWPREEPQTKVVVAARDLGAGTTLRDSDLTVVEMPRSQAPPDAVEDTATLVGKTLAVVRFKGEPITRRHLGPAVRLHPDERGVAVKVSVERGLAGLLRPGMKVGVVATLQQGLGTDVYAKILLEGVRVLYVPPEFQARPYEPVRATVDTTTGKRTVVGTTSNMREGIIVLAATSQPTPVRYYSEEALRLLDEGKLSLTTDGTLTVTLGLTVTTPVTDTTVLAAVEEERKDLEAKLDELQPEVRYVIPVEVLAALNAQGNALALTLLPQDPNDVASNGVHTLALQDMETAGAALPATVGTEGGAP